MSAAAADDHGGRQGFTLLELCLAAALLVVILMIGAALAGQASSSWHHVYNDTHATHDARKGLAALAEELRQSCTEVISVETGGTDYDTLTFQVPAGRVGTTILWGAEGTEDWLIRVGVEGGKLVRTVLDADGLQQGHAQVLATNVDRLHDGVKGFRVTMNDSLLSIRVRTLAQHGGHAWRKEVATTVWLRNQHVEEGSGDGGDAGDGGTGGGDDGDGGGRGGGRGGL